MRPAHPSGRPDELYLSPLVSHPSGYHELRGASALVALDADWLRLTGPDRGRFANGLVSCDLKSLSAGSGTYGFFTTPRGRVLADAAFLETGEDLWVELAHGLGPAIAEHMLKYVVADRVEIEEPEGWNALRVAGPSAGRHLVDALGVGDLVAGWHGGAVDVGGERILIRGDLRLGVPTIVLAGPHAAVAAAAETLTALGLLPASEAAVSAVRIEDGIPWFTTEFAPTSGPGGDDDEGFFPQETGLEDLAVSYEKGCYLGQEVVARIHFRGKVNRVLRGLLFEPGSRPEPGAQASLAGEVVGVTGGVAASPRFERPIGLSIVHRKAEPGAQLATAHGPCRLVELPFESESQP